jgi:hypothetical protein
MQFFHLAAAAVMALTIAFGLIPASHAAGFPSELTLVGAIFALAYIVQQLVGLFGPKGPKKK